MKSKISMILAVFIGCLSLVYSPFAFADDSIVILKNVDEVQDWCQTLITNKLRVEVQYNLESYNEGRLFLYIEQFDADYATLDNTQSSEITVASP
ncbi:MAG: hypothetical protein JRJ69_07720 [Deltaproteobacteria bacterium]|nr:hypothetical protein [Deltaproteobacteria bacterium]MBW1737429.1 hypothetical protein [Deltaproteobacteria bacterium]MBW1910560.1 hypothetical protein [Deltaproteobacteria bacterium]MBW2034596.1 hypothetical protein [Deltaproteobacteria bacterium]MBW2114970.1 hypothetical protein [Deltaproteobacteria bacterium]